MVGESNQNVILIRKTLRSSHTSRYPSSRYRDSTLNNFVKNSGLYTWFNNFAAILRHRVVVFFCGLLSEHAMVIYIIQNGVFL